MKFFSLALVLASLAETNSAAILNLKQKFDEFVHAPPANYNYPADLLDLSTWYLQVPFSDTGSYTLGHATQVKQPQLNTFKNKEFYVKQDGSSYAVVMHTPVVGVTISSSKHPRYEFRETTKSGATASFGANDGKTHTMYTKQKVTHLPAVA